MPTGERTGAIRMRFRLPSRSASKPRFSRSFAWTYSAVDCTSRNADLSDGEGAIESKDTNSFARLERGQGRGLERSRAGRTQCEILGPSVPSYYARTTQAGHAARAGSREGHAVVLRMVGAGGRSHHAEGGWGVWATHCASQWRCGTWTRTSTRMRTRTRTSTRTRTRRKRKRKPPSLYGRRLPSTNFCPTCSIAVSSEN